MDKNGLYFAYLRKSREDWEAEFLGQGETLARHEQQLRDLANRLGIHIFAFYREIVSGETIASRPQMRQLLSDVERDRPAGILVTEIERLARGDTRDQGLILETFQCSKTTIITPGKIYDPCNEFDQEYFEFGLFMSRREYKTINRRLKIGREASVREGKWTGNKAPYGYERKKLKGQKGFTLEIQQEEAQTVQLIFRLFTQGTLESGNLPAGTTKIAGILDDLGIRPKSAKFWEPSVIRSMLSNYAYIGKIQSGRRRQVKKLDQGNVTISRPLNHDFLLTDGLHPPIIDETIFYHAQKLFNQKNGPSFAAPNRSAFTGLLFCSLCGRPMYRRPKGNHNLAPTVYCRTRGCPCVGSYYELVEDRVLSFLDLYIKELKTEFSSKATPLSPEKAKQISSAQRRYSAQIIRLESQLKKAYDYFELELYSPMEFRSREAHLKEKLEQMQVSLAFTEKEKKSPKSQLSTYSQFFEEDHPFSQLYGALHAPEEKNLLLKHLIQRIDYKKTSRGTRYGQDNDCFCLDIHMRL